METGNRQLISGASVFCEGKLLGKTNSEGIWEFKTKCREVEVKASGYYEDEVLEDKNMEIFLGKLHSPIQNRFKVLK